MPIEPKKLPYLAYNWLSSVGASLAVVTVVTFLALWGAHFAFDGQMNPYFGIFLYMVLPPFLILGLLLIPIGMVRKWKRIQKAGAAEADRWPVVDLNLRGHRTAFAIFFFGSILFLLLSAIGSYGGYHYSESVSFCGETCHQVMEPEYTTYQNSPHARVACAECHVGPGADWFVRSKLSGAYQVYATLAHKYPRPIPTPIESLRPAQVTCEQCHWPEKDYGSQQREFVHYQFDETNSEWPISMLIKTGGGDPKAGGEEGIHWHMNIGVEVEYIARDEQRREIPWVKITDKRTGRQTVYQDADDPLTTDEIAVASRRVMDCMDCHNRPSHIFRSPDTAIDEMIRVGRIDRGLPYVKTAAVRAMGEEYDSREQALEAIANQMTDFYLSEYPEAYAERRVAIDDAIVATQEAYANNIFPTMRTDWADYPDNIGHMESIGCMRCHGGNHRSPEGRVLTAECEACHIILSQGSGESFEMAGAAPGLRFRHPEDIAEMWTEVGCYECHQGSQP